jgi:hypothetical protein
LFSVSGIPTYWNLRISNKQHFLDHISRKKHFFHWFSCSFVILPRFLFNVIFTGRATLTITPKRYPSLPHTNSSPSLFYLPSQH